MISTQLDKTDDYSLKAYCSRIPNYNELRKDHNLFVVIYMKMVF